VDTEHQTSKPTTQREEPVVVAVDGEPRRPHRAHIAVTSPFWRPAMRALIRRSSQICAMGTRHARRGCGRGRPATARTWRVWSAGWRPRRRPMNLSAF